MSPFNVEVGRHQYGFHRGSSFDCPQVLFHLGDYCSIHKSAHFIPVHSYYKAKRYAELYIERILCLHGVPTPSSLTEELSSLLIFGSSRTLLWVLT
jgi:hypothetical protein